MVAKMAVPNHYYFDVVLNTRLRTYVDAQN